MNAEEVRRLEVRVLGSTPVLAESLVITGDENIVDAQLVVHYEISRALNECSDGTAIVPGQPCPPGTTSGKC